MAATRDGRAMNADDLPDLNPPHQGPPPPGRTERFMAGWYSVRDVLADAERRLAAAGVPSPGPDTTILAAHVLGVPRTKLLLHDRMSPEDRTAFERLIARRMARIPLQHLVGEASFRRLDLVVGPGVFVPRPETELVVTAAIDALRALPEQDRVAVDLCSGSGAIALSLATEVSGARVTAVEVDPLAAAWLQRNVERHAATLRAQGSSVRAVTADATTCAEGDLAHLAGRVAVVASNPPYVPTGSIPREPEVRDHDPALALYGGFDGLSVVRGVVHTAAILLRAGGVLVVEHADVQGDAAGADGVPGLLREGATAECWRDVRDHVDLTRRPRYTTATRTALDLSGP